MEIKEECKKIEQSIPLFIEGKLSRDKTGGFLRHLSSCPDCMEELEINYLLTEGIRRAENGETFNLKSDLGKLIQKTSQRTIRREKARIFFIAAAVTLVFAAITVLMILLFKAGWMN